MDVGIIAGLLLLGVLSFVVFRNRRSWEPKLPTSEERRRAERLTRAADRETHTH
jgi:hypothetical protein